MRRILAFLILTYVIISTDCVKQICPEIPDQPHNGICDLFRG